MGRVEKGGLIRYPQVFRVAFDPMPKVPKYRTAIYISASCWGLLPGEAQASNEEQLEKCRQFIREHQNLSEVIVYENLEKEQNDPETKGVWFSLLDAAENREFDAVLVYNLNYIDESCAIASHHLARFFYPAGIRFISVSDDFDSKTDDMQEYLIRRTREYTSYVGTMRHINRFNEGRVNRCNVPYGYVYDPDHEPHIVIDEVTAPYVQELFDMQLQGMKPVEMARAMNEMGAVVPIVRRNQLYGAVLKDVPVWKTTAVKNILSNPMYTGDYVTGRKKERTIEGVNYAEKVDQKDWPMMENYHEPIVSREVFRRAQEIADGRRFANDRDWDSYYNPLRIMVKCRHCGNYMSRNIAGTIHSIREDATTFYCDSGRYDPDCGCKLFYVEETIVQQHLIEALKREQKKAKQFLERRAELAATETFNVWLQEIGKDRAALHESLKELIADGKNTDEVYRQLDGVTVAENHLMELFAEDNPWAQLFAVLEDVEAVIRDKLKVKKVLDTILVSRDGSVECHLKHEAIRMELEIYHRRLLQEGGQGLWEEETVQ